MMGMPSIILCHETICNKRISDKQLLDDVIIEVDWQGNMFLIQTLQPLLGGKPEIIFIFLILAFAIITTNFANNAGMAVVLIPVVIAFSDQYPGVDATVLCMSITMMVFVALLTPAASPYCEILHARKDLVEYKEIMQLFLPMIIIALVTYTLVGYQIAKFLFK